MTYTVASLKYDGKDDYDTDDDYIVTKPTYYEKPTKNVDTSNKECDSGTCDGEAAPTKDVIKSNVLEDFNNISKYNVELDDLDVEEKRTDLNNELDDALRKRETVISPSKELNDLLENGPKSNYVPDTTFNNNLEEEEEEDGNEERNEINEVNEIIENNEDDDISTSSEDEVVVVENNLYENDQNYNNDDNYDDNNDDNNDDSLYQ